MVQIPDSLIEAAKIDGAGELSVFWTVAMPMAKPAWITLIILSFQNLLGTTVGTFLYTEKLKPVSYALSQIISAGVARTGVAAAVSLVMLAVPVAVFIISQSNVIETMATSGIKG
jgi:ABC-type glycerol-3-phosphate transport system permease component